MLMSSIHALRGRHGCGGVPLDDRSVKSMAGSRFALICDGWQTAEALNAHP